ncbi:MAG: hypothetical protein BM564_13360 [Bacteroidetes bacterium MedPE-SWsnd-G2]|nr:MAG: hypothetical protein BM564_13360 [Bacteroidetes bacterium MedPE-SWsnd-G2]
MKRSYYSTSITEFLNDDPSRILGELNRNHSHALEESQRNAWIGQIAILKDQLKGLSRGQVYFEFAIPRMGKRVDVIVIIDHIVFVIEFKVGDQLYGSHAIEQVIDYTLDLKNFQQGSHDAKLIPVVVSTKAPEVENNQKDIEIFLTAAKTNDSNIKDYLEFALSQSNGTHINTHDWETSIYKPTPTIVEAAQALYKGHNVKEISRSDSGAINLSRTAKCLNEIIENSKSFQRKSICFVTGVPGAGKTLAGLNIANERMKSDEDEHAVFLSGNGPLVDVLREALTRDEVITSKEAGNTMTKAQSRIKANSFIQNIHHFRDDNLISEKAPVEKVVVFDEAQRAWNEKQASYFMKTKKGIDDFNKSEPEFLIEVMNRHDDWCTIVCLIGGGQEINTGEAGLQAWIESLKDQFSEWDIHYSELIEQNDLYVKDKEVRQWLSANGNASKDLHLAVSVRSFRSEQLSNFVHELLEVNKESVKELYSDIKNDYPLVVTRDIDFAKNWLRGMSRGTERIGLVGSSGARRLRPFSLDVKNEISPANWFLNDKYDIRSSSFLEVVATEYDIQGLEIDWVCMAWGADFHLKDDAWNYQSFKGTAWQKMNQETIRQYLKNTYRVLLTRARQGMVIFIPDGSELDHTRLAEYYDETFNYFKEIGIQELKENMFDEVHHQEPPKKEESSSTKKKKVLKKPQTKIPFESAKSEDTSKLKIGKLVKLKMTELIKNNLLSESEIRNLQRADYSKQHLHLNYPFLKKALPSDPNNIPRYWAGKVDINGTDFFICSEWYENPSNNDRLFFLKWLKEINNK